jgi:hypothetical protein
MSIPAEALVSLVMKGSEEYPVLITFRRFVSRLRLVLHNLCDVESNKDACYARAVVVGGRGRPQHSSCHPGCS